MRKIVCIQLLFPIMAIMFTACLDCAECTNCADPADNVEEICYRDGNNYYSTRREWRDDVKAYESTRQCDCR